MGGSHDDAIFVGQFGVQRVVFVEAIVPHGRPEVIGFEPQQQFKDVGVELVIIIPVFLIYPARE